MGNGSREHDHVEVHTPGKQPCAETWWLSLLGTPGRHTPHRRPVKRTRMALCSTRSFSCYLGCVSPTCDWYAKSGYYAQDL
ncbi:hypothetical protein WJX82_011319 [Trebouxia sp. C0006]